MWQFIYECPTFPGFANAILIYIQASVPFICRHMFKMGISEVHRNMQVCIHIWQMIILPMFPSPVMQDAQVLETGERIGKSHSFPPLAISRENMKWRRSVEFVGIITKDKKHPQFRIGVNMCCCLYLSPYPLQCLLWKNGYLTLLEHVINDRSRYGFCLGQ